MMNRSSNTYLHCLNNLDDSYISDNLIHWLSNHSFQLKYLCLTSMQQLLTSHLKGVVLYVQYLQFCGSNKLGRARI